MRPHTLLAEPGQRLKCGAVVGDLLQPTHLLFVLVVALLVLGPKRLPEVGRALGRGLRDFRSAISGEEPPEPAIPPTTDPPPPEASAQSTTPAATESTQVAMPASDEPAEHGPPEPVASASRSDSTP